MAQVDKEVDQIDKFLHSDPDDSEGAAKVGHPQPKSSNDSDAVGEKGGDTDEKKGGISTSVYDEGKDSASMSASDEKPPPSPVKPQQRVKTAVFRASPLPLSLYFRRARRFLKSKVLKTSTGTGVGEPWMPQQTNPAARTVYRMVRIRRLVTSLTRLLSTKADLIRQIRKRLVTRGEWSLDSDPELYIHLGDILGQSPLRANERYSEYRYLRPHLVFATGSRSLRTDVGPVTPNIPNSTAYSVRQDQRKHR